MSAIREQVNDLPTYDQIKERDRNAIEDVRERLMAEYPGALGILRQYDFVICPRADYAPYERQSREAARNEAARAALRKATQRELAIPYSGAITYCQISVANSGRAVGFHRCNGKARYVRRLKEDPGGDGRVAVCANHRSDPTYGRVFRHVNSPNTWAARVGGPGATEVVEPEYQP